MKEESRIEALELELKILKNEIHSTLLEIREQILNHYYPELRADEPLRSLSLPVRPPQTRPGLPVKSTPRTSEPSTISEIEAKGQVQPFSDIFLEDLSEDDDNDIDNDEDNDIHSDSKTLVNSRRINTVALDLDDDADDDLEDDMDDVADLLAVDEEIKVHKIAPAPTNKFGVTPQTREVDFRQLKQAAAGAKSTTTPAPEKVEAPGQKANRPNFAALATWVGDGVATVGKERTTQVVETYATGGKLSNEVKNSLLQLVSLAGDEEPATPVGSQEMLGLMVRLDQILEQK